MVEYLPLGDNDLLRFWSKVQPQDNGCWQWTAGKSTRGYGIFSDPIRRCRLAHRYSLVLATGEKKELCALHTCDNPSCVNPSHLYWGTEKDNIRDCYKRGREKHAPPGEDHHWAKLNNRDIREIRSAHHDFLVSLAARYGVTTGAIRQIVQRLTWKSVA